MLLQNKCNLGTSPQFSQVCASPPVSNPVREPEQVALKIKKHGPQVFMLVSCGKQRMVKQILSLKICGKFPHLSKEIVNISTTQTPLVWIAFCTNTDFQCFSWAAERLLIFCFYLSECQSPPQTVVSEALQRTQTVWEVWRWSSRGSEVPRFISHLQLDLFSWILSGSYSASIIKNPLTSCSLCEIISCSRCFS